MPRPRTRPPEQSTHNIRVALKRAINYVESTCEPGRMTPPQALVFTTQLIEHLKGNIEALQDEIQNEVRDAQRRAASSKTGAMR